MAEVEMCIVLVLLFWSASYLRISVLLFLSGKKDFIKLCFLDPRIDEGKPKDVLAFYFTLDSKLQKAVGRAQVLSPSLFGSSSLLFHWTQTDNAETHNKWGWSQNIGNPAVE